MGKVLFALYAESIGRGRQGALSQGDLGAARAAGEPAPHDGGRVLAQADLPAPDVGRRHVHGVAVSREVRGGVRRAGRARRRGQAGAARREAPARSEDRPALSRLGREQAGALGEPGDRAVVAVLGARRRLVRDGASSTCSARCPRIIRGGGRSWPSSGGSRARWRPRRTRRPASGGKCWTRADAPGNYRGGVGIGDVRLRARRRVVRKGWLDAKQFAPVAARGYAGIVKSVRGRPTARATSTSPAICKVGGARRQPVSGRHIRLLHRDRSRDRRAQRRRRVHSRQRGARVSRQLRTSDPLSFRVLFVSGRADAAAAPARKARAGDLRRPRLRRGPRREDEGDRGGAQGDRGGVGGGRRDDLCSPAAHTSPDRFISKSNITLFVDAGTVLKFTSDFDDYLPMVRSRWEGTEVVNSRRSSTATRSRTSPSRAAG